MDVPVNPHERVTAPYNVVDVSVTCPFCGSKVSGFIERKSRVLDGRTVPFYEDISCTSWCTSDQCASDLWLYNQSSKSYKLADIKEGASISYNGRRWHAYKSYMSESPFTNRHQLKTKSVASASGFVDVRLFMIAFMLVWPWLIYCLIA